MIRTLLASLALCVPVLLALPASAQEAAPNVVSVGFSGLERISEQQVRARVEVQPGQPFNPRAVARDIRRLYDTNYFTNIKADAREESGGIALTYIVEEKRVIGELRIIGNDKIKTRKVLAALSMHERDSFIPEAFPDEIKAILELYESKGYANTTVDVAAEKIGPSRVRVTYSVQEGRKARIKSLRVEGNEVLSDKEIRKIMTTKKARWFLGGKFDETKFENDLQQIVNEYRNHGRLEMEITNTEVSFSPKGKAMHITLHVNEGPEYTVETLTMARNYVFDTDELAEKVKVHAGDVHNAGQIVKDANTLRDLYQNNGYIDAAVTPQVTVDREKKTTNVTHAVQEGDLKYIRDIVITGNVRTKDEIVRREITLKPGERFDGDELDRSVRRLNRTGYYEEVRAFPVNTPGDDLFTGINVDVKEGDRGTFNFGGGFSTDSGFGGFGELRLNNFDITNWPTFVGGGQEFGLKVNIGDRRDQFTLTFTDPEFLGYPLAFGFDIFLDSYRIPGDYSYSEEQKGLQLRLGKVLSQYNTIRTTWRFEETTISDLPFFLNRELRGQEGSSTTFSTTNEFERNTLDYNFDATRGARHLFTTEFAGMGGDNNFIKLEHDTTWYHGFGEEKKWVLMLRTREGFVTEYGSSDSVPLQDRYYAGGTNSVRGYKSHAIGPKVKEFYWFGKEFAVGGDLRWLTTIEMKYKINKTFRLYGFIDSGGVWRDAGDFDPSDMKHGAGIGFGVDVPRLGPIRIDYGFALNPDDGDPSGRLHMQTGFRF